MPSVRDQLAFVPESMRLAGMPRPFRARPSPRSPLHPLADFKLARTERGVDPPRIHDVADVLLAERERLPEGLSTHVERLASSIVRITGLSRVDRRPVYRPRDPDHCVGIRSRGADWDPAALPGLALSPAPSLIRPQWMHLSPDDDRRTAVRGVLTPMPPQCRSSQAAVGVHATAAAPAQPREAQGGAGSAR
jgi:hypothetical protein